MSWHIVAHMRIDRARQVFVRLWKRTRQGTKTSLTVRCADELNATLRNGACRNSLRFCADLIDDNNLRVDNAVIAIIANDYVGLAGA